nr:MAG TPA: hypothetical protein [Caudoviricetes sp.]
MWTSSKPSSSSTSWCRTQTCHPGRCRNVSTLQPSPTIKVIFPAPRSGSPPSTRGGLPPTPHSWQPLLQATS